MPFSANAQTAQYVEPHGENIINVLAYAFTFWDTSVRRELGGMLKKWLERFGLKDVSAGLDNVQQGVLRATYRDLETMLDLCMGSYGCKQLAAMIAQLVVSPKGSVIMIEEPEISLHPNLQALLPLLFADVIKKHEKQVIVTTHSSILTLALSDAVMGNEEYSDVENLSVEDIALYHVIRDKEGYTKVEPLELTEEGYPKSGVPSFVEVEKKLFSKLLERVG